MIRTIKAQLTGKSPLLMHAFPMAPIEALEKKSAEVQAEHSAYRDPEGKLYVPGVNVQRGLVAGAAFSKGKGRSTLAKAAAACVMVSPDRVLLDQDEYIVDTRPVVIPATKGRVLRHRPRFDKWSIEIEIEYDDALISDVQMRQIVDDTGLRVGLLDFRPEKKGPFGRFVVTQWKDS